MEIRSQKVELKKKIKLMWIVVAIIAVITLSLSATDYSSYKKGQEFAVASNELIAETSSNPIIDVDASYKEKCEKLYSYFSRYYSDQTINGVKYDMSAVRASHARVKDSMAELMVDAGYDQFGTYSVEKWFEYTSFSQYFWGYSISNTSVTLIFPILVLALLFAAALTIAVYRMGQKELIINEDSLVCRYNKNKSKQILIKDVIGVENTKSGLKLNGLGFNFKISLISNAEDLKNEIMNRKNIVADNENKNVSSAVTEADELKKFKELLDSGVITQEEFDAKKKQLLGL